MGLGNGDHLMSAWQELQQSALAGARAKGAECAGGPSRDCGTTREAGKAGSLTATDRWSGIAKVACGFASKAEIAAVARPGYGVEASQHPLGLACIQLI